MEQRQRKPSFYDDYGFRTDEQSHRISLHLVDEKGIQEQNANWIKLIQKIPEMKQKDQRSLKIIVRKGVANMMRAEVWQLLIQPPLKPFSETVGKQQLKQIDLDINRTVPTNKNVKSIMKDLRDVLNAIAFAFPSMGYCQGLNFIVAVLLLILPSQQSYDTTFHLLWVNNHMKLLNNLDHIHKKIFTLNKLIDKHYPQLFMHLKCYEVDPLFYATSWFITLYSSILPINYVFRIIETYILEGDKILYRVALQILKEKKKRLKKMGNLEEITSELKNFDEFTPLNQDAFFEEMFSISLSKKEIAEYQDLYQKENKKQ